MITIATRRTPAELQARSMRDSARAVDDLAGLVAAIADAATLDTFGSPEATATYEALMPIYMSARDLSDALHAIARRAEQVA